MQDSERAREVLAEILERMGIEATIDVRTEGERIILDVRGLETALVIGKKGQTLEALQYLVGKIVHRGEPEAEAHARPILVDAEGYRARREDSLVELALRLGKKAVRTRRAIAVAPMSAYDRRIMHLALGNVPGVTTRSEGEGIFRRLLIEPAPDKIVPAPEEVTSGPGTSDVTSVRDDEG